MELFKPFNTETLKLQLIGTESVKWSKTRHNGRSAYKVHHKGEENILKLENTL